MGTTIKAKAGQKKSKYKRELELCESTRITKICHNVFDQDQGSFWEIKCIHIVHKTDMEKEVCVPQWLAKGSPQENYGSVAWGSAFHLYGHWSQ